jgi:hypothetical protein
MLARGQTIKIPEAEWLAGEGTLTLLLTEDPPTPHRDRDWVQLRGVQIEGEGYANDFPIRVTVRADYLRRLASMIAQTI